MFKSKTTADSATMEEAFTNAVKALNENKLKNLIKLDNAILNKAISYFESLDISLQGLVDELKEDFSEEKIISVNSKNDTNEKQITINSLEDFDNEYRVVFAVDKLNEGWDVLNLYDIVRLYDTRDAKGGRPGKTTVQESQLIGRGARYYPFKLEENQDIYKRKYDNDTSNVLRVCETLHYHCSHNPRYITELNIALRQMGLFPEEKVEVNLILKDEFKATSFYRNGFIFLNKKVKNNPTTLLEYQEPQIPKRHTYALKTYRSASTTLLDINSVRENKLSANYASTHRFEIWNKTLLKKGLNKIPFYRFDNLKRLFPKLKSMDDFVTNEKYFGGIKVEVTGLQKDTKDLSARQQLAIVIEIGSKISNEISTLFGDYRGTKTFIREPLRKHFRNKKLSFSIKTNTTAETGKPTMRQDIDQKYAINLLEKDWYVYNENYGSSEEKFLVKYFDSVIDDLEKRFTNIYLLRNERFFKLYRFSDAKATEPDFVLFMTEKGVDKEVVFQLFIEPKGEPFIYSDSWKEEFLEEIEKESKIEIYQNQQFKLIGMPFYNEEFQMGKKKDDFDIKLRKIIAE